MSRKPYSSSEDIKERGEEKKESFFLRFLPPLLGLGLLLTAVLVIWRQFRHLSFHNVLGSIEALSPVALCSGFGATVLAYGILIFYDGLACTHVKAGLSWGKISFVSFCAYVLSHNLGCAAISGAAVRYRLYRNWGVPGRKIASIVAFCSLTCFLGMIGLAGLILLWQPGSIPILSHYGSWFPLMLGVGCGVILGLYVWSAYKKQSLSLRGYKIEVPEWKTAVMQIFVSMADMSAAALIAWCLIGSLPSGSTLTFGSFLGIYLFSYIMGLLANIPGGLGVFDGTMMVALSPWLSVSHIMAVVLMFRVMYYLVPLVLAGILFAAHEISLKAHIFHDKAFVPGRREQKLHQSEAYFSVKIAGSVQLFVAVITIIYAVMAPMPQFPPGFYRASVQLVTLVLALSGVALAAISFGLINRVALAWRLSIGILCLTEILLAWRHADWAMYFVVFCPMVILLPFRHGYYRKATILSEPLSPLLFVFLGVSVIGLGGLWWVVLQQNLGSMWWVPMVHNRYDFRGHCFLFILALGCFLTFWWSLRKTCLHPQYWTPLLAAAYSCLDHQNKFRHFIDKYALRPDGFFYDESKQAAIAFIRRGPLILALGEPVGNLVKTQASIWRLRDYAEQENCRLAFLQASETYKKLYEAMGLSQFYLAQDDVLFCSGETCKLLSAELKSVPEFRAVIFK